MCSPVDLLHIFRTPFLKNTSGRLVLKFSSERDVTAGVPQGSTDEPLLFNLFVNDLIFFIAQSKLSNYAHDLFVSGLDIKLTTSLLCSDFKTVESWVFFEKYKVFNPGKCHFICIGKNVTDSELLNFDGQILRNYREVEILDITLDKNKL